MPLSFVTRLLAGVLLTAGALSSAEGQEARDRAVEIRATIRQAPPRIALQWNAPAKATLLSQRIYRRTAGSVVWTELATLPLTAKTYADNAVTVGMRYEYFLYRVYDGLPGTASGWLSAGIRVPLVAERGKVILLVDETMAAPLATELAQFTRDLTGDGWIVLRQDVARTASVTSIRSAVQTLYQADPTQTTTLILFGHIPVPYSGDYAADGHLDHRGAWPADSYYADVDGTWTDSTVNSTFATVDRIRNIPGDGKFDQSSIPSDVELAVGRIDLSLMPVFGVSETELLRQYLVRNHQFRHRLAAYTTIPRRALIDDGFGFFGGEAFAATGWRSFTSLFGSANVRALDWFTTLQTQKYLFAYGCGAGGYSAANGVGTTNEFAAKHSQAVFNFLFGSYLGDWDNQDNLLRAPLGGTSASLGLASAWAGRPHWHLHPLGLGETIGDCTRRSQNNLASFPGGYESNNTARGVHIALMGDPTLRLHPVKPPTKLVTKPAAKQITLSWRAGGDSPVEGYIVSRATSPLGPFVRLRGGVAAGASFVDRSVEPGVNYYYLVRAVKRETTTSGSYLNSSQGLFSEAVATTAGTDQEIQVEGNGYSITDGDTAPLPAARTDFGAVEVGAAGVIRTFTVRNSGSATLTISSLLLSGTGAADFLVSNAPTSIAAGAAANFEVTFRPSTIGPRSAKLTLRNNDKNEASFDFIVGGIGAASPAAIEVTPPLLALSAPSNSTLSRALNVANPGTGTLAYEITSSLQRYHARDSDSFGGPAYNWVEISGTGTPIVSWPNLDESATGEIPVGFTFPYYGTGSDFLRIATNGFIAPRDSITFGQNGPLPNSAAPGGMIAPFWTDVFIDAGSRVFWQNVGGNFVVQYDNVSLLGEPASRFTCEAILTPAGEIFFQYKTLTSVSGNYTIGLQNGRCDDAVLVAYNEPYVHAGLAVRITPPTTTPWLTVPSASGNIAPETTTPVAVNLDTTGLAPGEYYAELMIKSNAATGAPVVVPVQLTVTP